MSASETRFVNIADLRKPPAVIITTEDGKRHEMVATTMGDFIETLEEIEKLGIDASPIEEAKMTIRTVVRAFPTLTEDDVRGWSSDILEGVYRVVMEASGQIVTTDAEEAEKANAEGKPQSEG